MDWRGGGMPMRGQLVAEKQLEMGVAATEDLLCIADAQAHTLGDAAQGLAVDVDGTNHETFLLWQE